MCGVTCEAGDLLRHLAALILTAYCVRVLDDLLDEQACKPVASVPYGTLALALAAAIDRVTSVSFFLACYGVGMVADSRARLTSGLRPWQESLLALGAGALLVGWLPILQAALCSFAVQALDDCRDSDEDRLAGAPNLAHRIGHTETLLLSAFALAAAAWLNPALPVAVAAAVATVEHSAVQTASCRLRACFAGVSRRPGPGGPAPREGFRG